MRPLRTLLVLLVLAAGVPVAASAQTVIVRVLDAETSGPIFGALTYLVDAQGRTAKNALSDERGRALFLGIMPGSFRVRVEMIGKATAETDLFSVEVGTTVAQELRLVSTAIELEGIEVELEAGRCRVRPGGEGLLVAEVWDEARKALSAAAFTQDLGTYRYETVTYERQIGRDSKVVLSSEERRREGYMSTPFESRPVEDLLENGFARPDEGAWMYFAPDAGVLLSDPFLDSHCLRLVDGRLQEDETAELLGLGFEPTGERRGVVDISGTMWLDRQTAELRWLEYRYENLPPEMSYSDVGGRVNFQRMPNGTWIVPEWWIQMPVVVQRSDLSGRPLSRIERFQRTGGLVTDVREAGGRSLGGRVTTGGVEGFVRDSVGVPLRGVRVGVMGSNQEVFSNAEGGFGITGLSEGRYAVRFVDPNLEAYGFVPEPVEQDVIPGEMAYLEYNFPSVGDVLFEACRGQAVPDASIVLAGMVRDSRGRAVPGATVRVGWAQFRVTPTRPTIDNFDVERTADEHGFYLFCGVPSGRLLTVRALHGERASEPVELRVELDETARLAVVVLPDGTG